jgi:hypothetical protein
MTAKTTNTLYWIFTILFGGLMIFSAIGGIQPTAQTIEMLHKGMGYPIYFIQFISIAKIIGALAILTPGLSKIKEWAYAGLFFDLIGAVYSIVKTSPVFNPAMLGMLAWFVTGVLSYYFWSKKLKTS